MRIVNVLSASVVTAVMWMGAASAGVDTEVPLPAKLQGSLGDGEVETVRFFAPAGSQLQVKLSTSKKSGLDPDLRVLDPDGAELPVPSANLADKGSSIKVKKLPLARSGTWALEISGAGAGDYKLVVKTKVPTKFVQDGPVGDADLDVPLAVEFGSTLKISAKALKGSPATPVLQSLDGLLLSGLGTRSDGSHKVTVTATKSGDLTLTVAGEGDPGSVRVSVTIKPPKAKTARVDVRAVSLGRPAGGETAVGRVILPAQGGTIVVDPGTDLGGAGIAVPPGALSQPTLISIRSAEPEALPDPEADASAGPTVELGPSGLQFSQPVTVTVPIDAAALPVQATADDITVLVVEADGSSQELVPTSVDLEAGVCTVPVSSFSRFTAVAPAGSPPLAGRSYWGFAFDADFEEDFSGADESGVRRVSRADVLLDFDTDGYSVNALLAERSLSFGHLRNQGGQIEGLLQTDVAGFEDFGYWQYGLDGRRIELQFGEDPQDAFFVSRDGSVLVNAVEEPDEGTPYDAILDVLVERPSTLDPTALVVGTYYFGGLRYFVEQAQPGGLVALEIGRDSGTLSLNANGTADVSGRGGSTFGAPQLGQATSVFDFDPDSFSERLTWTVDPSGTFAGSILLDVGDGDVLRILPHRDGSMFVALPVGDGMLDVSYIVGVKQSSKRSLAALRGEHAVGTLFVHPSQYQIEDGMQGSGQFLTLPDWELSSSSDRLIFDGTSTATLSGRAELDLARDPGTPGGVRRDSSGGLGDFPLQVALAKDGRFEVQVDGERLRGAITRSGSFGFLVPDAGQEEFGLVLFVDRPPEQLPRQ